MKKTAGRLPAVILLAVFLCMLIAGIIAGESLTVFRKVVKVCLECIGIG